MSEMSEMTEETTTTQEQQVADAYGVIEDLKVQLGQQSREIQRLRDRLAKASRETANDARPAAGSSSGNTHGYRVEVRDPHFSAHLNRPITLADGLVGPEWRTVEFERSLNPAGVPTSNGLHDLAQYGLLPYESALALAWTLVAQCKATLVVPECRVVRYSVRYSHAIYRDGVVDLPEIGGSIFSKPSLVKEGEPVKEGGEP